MLCKTWSIVKHMTLGKRISPLRCKCWHCEECAPIRQKGLWRDAMRGRPTTFITLTVNPAMYADPAERARALVVAWRNTRQAMKRKFGFKKVPFLAVFETTKAGEPHLHILARLPFVAQTWLSAQMGRLIGAPIVDIRRVHKARDVARYVSKYVSKEPRMWAGCKRYWRSLDWFVEKPKNREPEAGGFVMWARVDRPVATLIAQYYEMGWDIACEGEVAWAFAPFERRRRT